MRVRLLLKAMLLATVFVTTGVAQSTFGIIRGRVLDPSGVAVPGVNVTVTNAAGTGGNQDGFLNEGSRGRAALSPPR